MRWVMLGYLLASVMTFVTYGIDKRRATRGQWRVPEATLQTMSLCGGFVGALVGRRTFRHKLRKPHFTIVLYAIVTLHALAWVVWWTQIAV